METKEDKKIEVEEVIKLFWEKHPEMLPRKNECEAEIKRQIMEAN